MRKDRDDTKPPRNDKNTVRRARPKSGDAEAQAGPRPISARQQAYREQVLGVPPQDPSPGPTPTRLGSGYRTASEDPNVQVRVIRDASHTRVRRARPAATARPSGRSLNRRKRNWPQLLLGVSSVCLFATCVGAALFSPRLAIRNVEVAGNAAIPTPKLMARLKSVYGQNLIRLSSGQVQTMVLAEPTFEKMELHRTPPGTVRVVVTERKPWASVQLPDGVCYTIDAKMVPFRKTAQPEKGLPRLELAPAAEAAGTPGKPVTPIVLGKPMTAPGLAQVSRCLAWTAARSDFKLESVSIDPTGKLCLNRVGGVQVRLGSEVDLPRKLAALGLLLERRTDLRDGNEVAYVNLYAYDAPAVMPRATAPSLGQTSGTSEAPAESPDTSTETFSPSRPVPVQRGGPEQL